MCDNENIVCNNSAFKRELLFKYLVIGDFGVGKTSIIKRYAEDNFSSNYKITIGTDFALKTIEWDEHTTVNLQLWDIAGHERFGALTSVYYRYALAAAVVFDLTRPETFKSTEKWINDLRDRISLPNGCEVPVILLANKGDICLENFPEDIEEFCKKHNILTWLITSAKENVNLDTAMNILIQKTISACISNSNCKTPPVLLENSEKKVKIKQLCFF